MGELFESNSSGHQPIAEAADNYRNLVENSLIGIVIVQDEKIVYVNKRASELMDSDPSELLGVCVYDNIHPSDTKRIQQYHILKQLGRRVPKHYDTRVVTKSGTVHYLEIQSIDISYCERPALLVNLNDISERVSYADALKHSEERYRLLVENNPDIVLVIEDDCIAKANQASFSVLGYEPEVLVGRRPWEISPDMQPGGGSSKELIRTYISRAMRGESQCFEWVYKHKNGDPVDCEVNLVWCGSVETPYLQAIIRDIGERKHAEDKRYNLEIHLEAQKRLFFKNTILSFTDGKLDVVDPCEITPYIADSRLSVPIDHASDLLQIRMLVEKYLSEHGLDHDHLYAYLIGVGEAMTNALVHAEAGTLYAGKIGDTIWVAVDDDGFGIDSLLIPQATIGKGFSTKSSMGFGFTLMLEVADKILLATGPEGTTVLLMKYLNAPSERF